MTLEERVKQREDQLIQLPQDKVKNVIKAQKILPKEILAADTNKLCNHFV